MLLAVASVSVTAVAVLGGVGVLPTAQADERRTPEASLSTSELSPSVTPTPTPTATPSAETTPIAPAADALPADSGEGRRVVFSEGSQRVWIVGPRGRVLSTYLVSGSLVDNLQPGSYEVYSRSRWAVGVDDSGVMEYFVRFTRGENAAIGFHSIPSKNGTPLQTRAELGTPQSHGCIRQDRARRHPHVGLRPDRYDGRRHRLRSGLASEHVGPARVRSALARIATGRRQAAARASAGPADETLHRDKPHGFSA